VHQFFNRIMSKDVAWAITRIPIISVSAYLYLLQSGSWFLSC
jgi:hypothetical protein